MRLRIILILLIVILISCKQNRRTEKIERSSVLIRKEIISVAKGYVKSHLKDPKTTVTGIGLLIIEDDLKRYVIDPKNIFIGLIDEDANDDAIITISYLKGQYLEVPELLILIKTDGKFLINRVIESDMKILGIKERVITAEISTISRDSPLYGCSACKEIVKYQFKDSKFVKIE